MESWFFSWSGLDWIGIILYYIGLDWVGWVVCCNVNYRLVGYIVSDLI